MGLVDEERWEVAKGGLLLAHVAKGVVLATYHGALDASLVPHARAMVARVSSLDGPVSLFVDAEQVASYSTEYRVEVTRWISEERGKQLRELHMLFRSRLVTMGVSLLQMATGDFLKPHSDRASFERALAVASGANPAPSKP